MMPSESQTQKVACCVIPPVRSDSDREIRRNRKLMNGEIMGMGFPLGLVKLDSGNGPAAL